jgi:hypothetical protein
MPPSAKMLRMIEDVCVEDDAKMQKSFNDYEKCTGISKYKINFFRKVMLNFPLKPTLIFLSSMLALNFFFIYIYYMTICFEIVSNASSQAKCENIFF